MLLAPHPAAHSSSALPFPASLQVWPREKPERGMPRLTRDAKAGPGCQGWPGMPRLVRHAGFTLH